MNTKQWFASKFDIASKGLIRVLRMILQIESSPNDTLNFHRKSLKRVA